MKVIVLTENTTSNQNLLCEHGLSLYIETEKYKILFDMGQTELFAQNAEKLGVDLAEVDFAVLSHGHYDHGGGLQKFLEINKKAPLYVSRYAFGPYYNGTEKYIGLNESLSKSDRIIYTDGVVKIAEGLTLHHCNDKRKKYDLGSFGLNKKMKDHFVSDDFLHEQYLSVEENGKRILFSGCSHRGILNIVEWFCPDVLIGGFHFSQLALDEVLEGYAKILDNFETIYYTCHCTGVQQYEFMKKKMKNLFYAAVGDVIDIL